MRTVEPLASGRFKVRFRHGGKSTSESFDTKREGADFAKWLDALGSQGALDRLYANEQIAARPTLNQVAADHIKHMEGAGDGHRLKSQRLWDRTWGPRIGSFHATLEEITRDRLVAALDDLARNGRALGRGYSPKSLSNQRGLLYGVLERCVNQGYMTKNPGKKLKIPQVTVALHMDDEDDPAEMHFLTLSEFGVLYWAMSPHYRPFLRFLAGTGCRWGEAVVLRVRDVQLNGVPAVNIRRALKWSPDGNFTIGPPKTKKSRRTVTIGPEVVEDIRELVRGKSANDLVFTAPKGKMISHRTFWSDHWRPAIWRAQQCDRHRAGDCRCGTAHPKRCTVHEKPPPPCGCEGTLTQTPRIHDLRHSHASWVLAKFSITVVQVRLGHESIQTTVDTYGHLEPDVQVAAAKAANLNFGARPKELTSDRGPGPDANRG